MEAYDLITVGGGLGGATLAKSMAERGHRVLVLERDTEFRDRVRGEQMASWGAAEARELGIYELLCETCAHAAPWWDIYVGPLRVVHRDLRETTPAALPNLTFYHPSMQETLIGAAEAAGATVIRGARVTAAERGRRPSVTYERNGTRGRASARLVVAADGRNSPARKWAALEEQRDPSRLQIAGVLLDDVAIPDDALQLHFQPEAGRLGILFPQGGGRVRAYFASRTGQPRLSGEDGYRAMIGALAAVGIGPDVFAGARMAGPLATFDGADSWVKRPYREGVALVGDAAATSDPAWGQGLSLTVRDVRTLRDELVAHDDWDVAGKAYAEAHDAYYEALHEIEGWFTTFWYEIGPEADAMRARLFPRRAQEGFPDPFQSGPETVDVSPEARRRFFGEDGA